MGAMGGVDGLHFGGAGAVVGDPFGGVGREDMSCRDGGEGISKVFVDEVDEVGDGEDGNEKDR